MDSILQIKQQYSNKLVSLDLDLLIAAAINKPREFVLAHPEYILTKSQVSSLRSQISRRIKGEPIAYILGKKEFYGLEFKVNKHTLIPRPETETLVELASHSIQHKTYNKKEELTVVDIGTGSGNIIVSIVNTLDSPAYRQAGRLRGNDKIKFFGIDISKKALQVAKQNVKKHKVDKKIKFLHGNLLEPFIKKSFVRHSSFIILANLPYLSSKIYSKVSDDIKKYEPKSALYSPKEGLHHYEKLFKQIKNNCSMLHVVCFMEISPEQKNKLEKLVKKYFPKAKIAFYKDLAKRWRICKIEL